MHKDTVMKRMFRLSVIIALSVFAVVSVYPQCVPDTVHCMDINEPGEICPAQLPDATVDVPYEEVITVIPPGEASFGEVTVVIDHIILDSVGNLPGGIGYAANAVELYADSFYCINISGIPASAGVFPLSIYITPWIVIGTSVIPYAQILNDTSVVLTVNEAAGLDRKRYSEFLVLPNIPNPFSDITRISFFTPYDDRIGLEVYNILGELMYQEKMGSPPGEHYFEFNGRELLPGTYFYRVTNHKEVFTGKFIKARK
jgi:hypothetical protein